MFYVNIHPWIGQEPNQSITIATYEFDSHDDAVEFTKHYNAQSLAKVALIQDTNLQLETV